jgi:phosphoserine phosphatase RsbX
VLQVPGGVLFGLVDALGHGPDASAVADAAVAALGSAAPRSIADRVRECHRALAGTRGAVAALAAIDPGGWMSWSGVGNVECVLLRRREGRLATLFALTSLAGVLGLSLPALRETRVQVRPGDHLVMATDGIEPAFELDVEPGDTPAAATRRIVARRHRRHDDGLVLAAHLDAGAGEFV